MRQILPSVINDFSKGLITETTEISFPQNASTETFNCIFDRTGFVARRKAFDFEDNFVITNTPATQTGAAFTEFVWTSVAGDGTISFLIQQHGSTLFFYDISTSIDVSSNKKAFSVNLTTYLPSGSGRNAALYPCQYASGRGILSIVSSAISPIYIIYDTVTNTITTTAYDIKTRDFTGLTDDLDLTERPIDTVATLKVNHPAHYYNLLNQGWGEVQGAALTAWDTARADMPSNADYIALYRSSPTAIFDNNRVLHQDPLNTPAAKGHFILTTTNPNRTQAMLDDGFTLTLTNPANLISASAGTIFRGGGAATDTGGFDGVYGGTYPGYGQSFGFSGSSGYAGKNFSSSPKQIDSCIVYGLSDHGFYRNTSSSENVAMTFTLMASQTLPASKTNGTTLGSVTFTNQNNEIGGRTMTSNDLVTFWNYVWIYQSLAGVSGTALAYVSEIEFYSPGSGASSGVIDNISTIERPKTICFFAGRLFYAGLDAFSLGNTIFFTQILQTESQYGQCYQVNDPTNENIFALLPSDGGTIAIPEMGVVRKLFAYQNALLILASNGVWMVTGGSSGGYGGGFQANDYFVKKLSSVGTSSPLSILDRRGVPIWWAEDGIYTVQYDPNFNSFNVVNMTFKTIRSFFLDIPQANRKYAKAAYDSVLDICYWVYNSEEDPDDNYTYDSVLVFSGINQAFYPWTIGDATPKIKGIVAVQDAARNNLTQIKYTTTYPDSSNDVLLYSNHLGTTYYDWVKFGTIRNFPDISTDYTSYFITSYKVDGKLQQFFQANYIWVFEEMIEDASCYVQGLFDFYINPNSGKWSTPQQVCKSFDSKRAVNFKRLKIRGKGRSLQLKFYSETGKPFQIQGWALYESINAQP